MQSDESRSNTGADLEGLWASHSSWLKTKDVVRCLVYSSHTGTVEMGFKNLDFYIFTNKTFKILKSPNF